MAVNFLDNLDLNDNQLLNARLQNLASDPGTANAGDIIYNTSSNLFKFYNGTAWIDPSAGTYTGWTITGDSGTTANVTSGAAVVFVGGLGMTTTSNGFNVTTDLDEATATTRGGIELFSNTDQSVAANSVTTTASRTYGLQLNSSGQGVVNVPWTDTTTSVELNFDASDGSSSQVANNGTMTFVQGNGITTTGDDGGNLTITNIKPFDSLTLASTTGSNSTIANSGTITIAAGTGITTSNNASGTVTIAATGSGSMSSFTVAGDTGSDQTISDGNTLTLTGTTNGGITTVGTATDTIGFEMAISDLSNYVGTYDAGKDKLAVMDFSDSNKTRSILPAAIPVNSWGDATGTIDMGANKILDVADPTAAQDAATKNYVDTNIVGNLVFQGGYNAATNTPDLDSSPSASIKKGWAYVVTAAGSFFTETVEVGDFLFAQSDAPTALADWVTVQNNIGIATTTTPGIASFADASFAVSAAGQVTLDDSGVTTGAYGTASAVPRFSVNTKGQITASVDTTISITSSQVSNFDTAATSAITEREFVGTSSSATTHTFTHNLSSTNVTVQLFDTSSRETVYATVARTSANVVTATTAAAASLTCLVTRIG